MKKLVLAGGSGFVGSFLKEHFQANGWDVVTLTRRQDLGSGEVHWNPSSPGDWVHELEGAAVVINLAGKSVNCRNTEANRKAILESRLASTRAIGNAIASAQNPPKLWINASSGALYKESFNQDRKESDEALSYDFASEVSMKWEQAFFSSQAKDTRKVALRISFVLGRSEDSNNPVNTMVLSVKMGSGGRQGSGKQYMSWIHQEDMVRAIEHIIVDETIHGPVNFASPGAVTNKKFNDALSVVLKPLFRLPVPTWLLKIGCAVIGTDPNLILRSRKIYPQVLLDKGFEFRFSEIEEALADLLGPEN